MQESLLVYARLSSNNEARITPEGGVGLELQCDNAIPQNCYLSKGTKNLFERRARFSESRQTPKHVPGVYSRGLTPKSPLRTLRDYVQPKSPTPRKWQSIPTTWDGIRPAAERNLSQVYLDWYDYYMEKEGDIGSDGNKKFFKLVAKMEERVFSEVDVVPQHSGLAEYAIARIQANYHHHR
ncbi:MAG: hypothetical protein Q9179_006178 [Wetmoreana sp. 5 TL-2023]